MSDCRFGVSPVSYPDPDPDPEIVGFDPRGRRGNILVSEHVFLSDICRDDTK